MTLPPTHSDEVATVSSIGWVGKLRLREEEWTRSLVQGDTARTSWDLNPAWLSPAPTSVGWPPRGAGGARASWSPGDWLALHGKPGPHWALQLVGAEKSEAATSSANELPH